MSIYGRGSDKAIREIARSVAFGEDHGVGRRPPAINASVADGSLVEGKSARRCCGLGFDGVLALAAAAPHGFDEVAPVQRGVEFVHVAALDDVSVQEVRGLTVHGLVDVVEECGDFLRNIDESDGALLVRVAESDGALLVRVAAGKDADAVLDVAGTDLDAQRRAFHLPFVELPADGLVSFIHFHADARLTERVGEFSCLLDDALFMLRDGDDHRLHGRDAGREFEPALVAVRHDERADETGGNAPARLIRILEFAVTVEIFDLERGREVFAEIMRSAGLQRLYLISKADAKFLPR